MRHRDKVLKIQGVRTAQQIREKAKQAYVRGDKVYIVPCNTLRELIPIEAIRISPKSSFDYFVRRYTTDYCGASVGHYPIFFAEEVTDES